MPQYFYTARHTKTGKETEGSKEAESKEALASELKREGFLLVKAVSDAVTKVNGEEVSDISGFKRFLARAQEIGTVPLTERMIFARHLAIMIRSGFSLAPAIGVLGEQTKNKRFQSALQEIRKNIEAGTPLSESFRKQTKIFNELFVNMIQVGETAGNLDEVLFILADQMKKDHEVRSKVKGAMMYPAVIVVAMIGIGIAMMILVVPKLAATLLSFGVELPVTTRLIIGMADFMSNNTLLIVIGFISFIIGLTQMTKVLFIKKGVHWLMLHAPVVKALTQKVNSARFSRIFSSLLKSGVPVVEALHITSNTLSNYHFKTALNSIAKHVQKGEQMQDNFLQYPSVFPAMVSQMIGVGEQSGTLSDVLENLADFFEEEVTNTTKNLTSIIEPVIMLVVGAGVAFFALSMMQPMFSLISGV